MDYVLLINILIATAVGGMLYGAARLHHILKRRMARKRLLGPESQRPRFDQKSRELILASGQRYPFDRLTVRVNRYQAPYSGPDPEAPFDFQNYAEALLGRGRNYAHPEHEIRYDVHIQTDENTQILIAALGSRRVAKQLAESIEKQLTVRR